MSEIMGIFSQIWPQIMSKYSFLCLIFINCCIILRDLLENAILYSNTEAKSHFRVPKRLFSLGILFSFGPFVPIKITQASHITRQLQYWSLLWLTMHYFHVRHNKSFPLFSNIILCQAEIYDLKTPRENDVSLSC